MGFKCRLSFVDEVLVVSGSGSPLHVRVEFDFAGIALDDLAATQGVYCWTGGQYNSHIPLLLMLTRDELPIRPLAVEQISVTTWSKPQQFDLTVSGALDSTALHAHLVWTFGAHHSMEPSMESCSVKLCKTEAELKEHFGGGTVPEKYLLLLQKGATGRDETFFVEFQDPDIYFVAPQQSISLMYAIDKSKGMAHNLYVFEAGVRDMAKIKTAAQTNACPTQLWIPQVAGDMSVGVELEVVAGYMQIVGSNYNYVWSAPYRFCVVENDREARVRNAKRREELRPKVDAGGAEEGYPQDELDDEDHEVVAGVVSRVKPFEKQLEVKKALEESRIGKHVLQAKYQTLRTYGFDTDMCACILGGATEWKKWTLGKLEWSDVLVDIPQGKRRDVATSMELLMSVQAWLVHGDETALVEVGKLPISMAVRVMIRTRRIREKFMGL